MAFNFLIVDDSFPMRSVIIKMIKASGFGKAGFYEAADGAEALRILGKEWLDIVVTDYNMPQMDGIELIKAMKNMICGKISRYLSSPRKEAKTRLRNS
jgi:two-component system chemotaxis response regulator CheY